MAQDRVTSTKLIPLLEGYQRTNTVQQNEELAYSLVVLGPQVHQGKRYAAVNRLGEDIKAVPTNPRDGTRDLSGVVIHITEAR